MVTGDSFQMSVEDNGKIIWIDFEIRTRGLDKLKEAAEKLRSSKKEMKEAAPVESEEFIENLIGELGGQDVTEEIGKILQEEIKKPEATKSIFEQLEDVIGRNTSSGIPGKEFLTNPIGAVLTVIQTVPIIGQAITAAIVISQLGPRILDWLMQKGNLLDRFFKRLLADELNVGRSREQRQEVRVGVRQVIFTRESGSTDPEYAFNSFQSVRNHSIYEMDIFRVRKGYQY